MPASRRLSGKVSASLSLSLGRVELRWCRATLTARRISHVPQPLAPFNPEDLPRAKREPSGMGEAWQCHARPLSPTALRPTQRLARLLCFRPFSLSLLGTNRPFKGSKTLCNRELLLSSELCQLRAAFRAPFSFLTPLSLSRHLSLFLVAAASFSVPRGFPRCFGPCLHQSNTTPLYIHFNTTRVSTESQILK